MAYRYFLTGSPVTFYSPKEQWANSFQTLLDNQFPYATDFYTIREETYFGSGSYQNVDVRINTAVDSVTGMKLGDDFKVILFQDIDHTTKIGEKYFFDDNYWLTVNTENIKNLTAGITVRRCNNVLRWMTASGSYLSEPCIIDYKIATPDNKSRSDPIISDGTIKIVSQLNDRTQTISENQRFLFGNTNNWVAYRVYGGGLNNFLNNEGDDNSTAQLLEIATGKHFVNDEWDNTTLGIADYWKYFTSSSAIVSSVQILPTSGSIFESGSQLFTVYLYSGNTQLGDTFTITVSGSNLVPDANYVFSASANSFSVSNVEKYLDEPLLIQCLSGSAIRIKEIYLRGGW